MRDSKTTSSPTTATLAAALLLGSVFAVAAARAEPVARGMCVAPAARTAPKAATGAAPVLRIPIQMTGGQRAYIDPVSRQLIAPPDAEKRILEVSLEELEALSFSGDGLETFRTADGGVGVHLGGRFQVAEFATVGADGKAAVTHAWAVVPPPAAKAAEVKP